MRPDGGPYVPGRTDRDGLSVGQFCARRWIGDGWYVFRFPAAHWADAEEFCRRAGAHLDGEFIAAITAAPGAGSLVRAATWLRNWWRHPWAK